MKFRLSDIEIDPKNPFKNCRLEREQYAKILTKVIEDSDDGCVLSIHGEWGSGKTTFIRMWKQLLANEGYKTLLFNVWEHDFVSDPIIGLIGQFNEIASTEETQSDLKKVGISAAKLRLGKIATNLLPALTKNIANKIVGKDTVDILEALVQSASSVLTDEIDNYKEQCLSIYEFRKSIETLVKSCTDNKPLIFFVDELDRCNPHYAIKVLERIKHLFTVKNIIFVLSIDKLQLCNSIKGYFGNEFNANEYLKRFIDLEYHLPLPTSSQFSDYLFVEFGIDKYFGERSSEGVINVNYEISEFKSMANSLFEDLHLNLRQLEKIYVHMGLALKTFHKTSNVHPGVIFLLLYFRQSDLTFYNTIKNRELIMQDMVYELEKRLPEQILTLDDHSDLNNGIIPVMLYYIGELLICYDNNPSGINVFIYNDFAEDRDRVRLQFNTKKIDSVSFARALDNIRRDVYHLGGQLPRIIEHIELLHNLTAI